MNIKRKDKQKDKVEMQDVGENTVKNKSNATSNNMMEAIAKQNPEVQTGDVANGISEITTEESTTTNDVFTLTQSVSECPDVETKTNSLIDKNIDQNKLEFVCKTKETRRVESSHEGLVIPVSTNCTTDELISPVPNFRVEGSGTGDSSITVAVATLTSAVHLNSNSVENNNNGDGPNSGSGPVSVQSSEDMKLSLVSWYSEPEDPLRISTDNSCCDNLQNSRQAISMTGSLLGKGGSEEKENQTPEPSSRSNPDQNASRESVLTFANGDVIASIDCENDCNNSKTSQSQRTKMHVQLLDQKSTISTEIPLCTNKKHSGSCQLGSRNGRPECPRCSRRSKSGSTTPATAGFHHCPQSRSRIPANRRVIASSKSSTELKKPIKSILKNDSRGSGGSGSGSDNKSSMDSLGSADLRMMTTPLRQTGTILMTRSESSTRAKFNLNHQIYSDTPNYSSDDKLRRIEKYATLRLRKNTTGKTLDLSDTELNGGCTNGGSKIGSTIDLMTKSMSFLEKSSGRGDNNNLPFTPSSANSTLKRQGSLRMKKSSPQWEPCTTRTTALRMQKMQEAKAKSSGFGGYSAMNGHPTGGSAHSGSGESIHHISQHQGTSHSHSAPISKSHSSIRDQKPTRVFAKLSSASGQTASSNQKRLKQEKAIQTDVALTTSCTSIIGADNSNGTSLSPIPSVDIAVDLADQIRQLEKLANRYRNTALRFQYEFEKSEAKKIELTKQLLETQSESSEMIDFLTAEKATLAESLTEIENEAKNWRDQIKMVKAESQNRISSLVRLSEQNKQESLKSQTLLNRLEGKSSAMISSLTTQISDGTASIYMTRQKIISLTNALLSAYELPQELLESFTDPNEPLGIGCGASELSSSLLVPLISSLAKSFPASLSDLKDSTDDSQISNGLSNMKVSKPETIEEIKSIATQSESENVITTDNSLNNLNQAILDREAAEKVGLDGITCIVEESTTDDDSFSLKLETSELNAAISKLLLVVRVIVLHCDKKVSNVASSILQCLQSIEDDKYVTNIPEIAKVQKSLEAWQEKPHKY